MKKITSTLLALALLVTPSLSLAQQGFDADNSQLTDFFTEVLIFINDVLIPFILGVAFLFFVWGVFRYFIAGGADEEKREQGKKIIIYSLLGFVIIIIFWGLVNLLAESTGFEGDRLDDIPQVDNLIRGGGN